MEPGDGPFRAAEEREVDVIRAGARGRKVWHMIPICSVLCAAGVGASCGDSFPGPRADLIVTNAKIWTVDPAVPRAEAVAVAGDRIVAVGSAADVAGWRGEGTRV